MKRLYTGIYTFIKHNNIAYTKKYNLIIYKEVPYIHS